MKPDYFAFAADNARREFQAKAVCRNCGQWKHPSNYGEDCLNECTKRGLEPADPAYVAYLKGEQPDPRD